MISAPSIRLVCKPKCRTKESAISLSAEEFQFVQKEKQKNDINAANALRKCGAGRALSEYDEDLSAIHLTPKGFLIVMHTDNEHFQPGDFKITVTRDSVLVNAERKKHSAVSCSTSESDSESMSVLRRHYSIPADVLLGSIHTTITDSGILIIKGNRANQSNINIPVVQHSPINNRSNAEQNLFENGNAPHETTFPVYSTSGFVLSKSFDV